MCVIIHMCIYIRIYIHIHIYVFVFVCVSIALLNNHGIGGKKNTRVFWHRFLKLPWSLLRLLAGTQKHKIIETRLR